MEPTTGEYTNNTKTLVGLSAQEVENILPLSITESRRPVEQFPDDDTLYKTFPYQDVFVLLIKAVQELSTKVTAMENA